VSKSKIIILLAVTILLCTPGVYPQYASAADQKGPVTVASKIDTEGALLGQMIMLMLRDSGFEVKDKTEFGPTDLIRKAIINGEIDIYPEYTGNGGFFFSNTDPAAWKDAWKGYKTVSKLDLEANRIVWLKPAPANNTWAIAVRKDLSAKENIKNACGPRPLRTGRRSSQAGRFGGIREPSRRTPRLRKGIRLPPHKAPASRPFGGNTAQTEKADG